MLMCTNGRVDDEEPPCVTSDQRCDGIIDCIGGEDEEEYNCPCEPEGAVRLVGNPVPYPYQGRVEFCVGGSWSTICTRRTIWNTREASVVCRQLGYDHEGLLKTLCTNTLITYCLTHYYRC